jgi:hypothetical protein
MRAMKSRPNAKLLSIKQAEEETGLPSCLIRDLLRRGVLEAVQPPGVRRVFVRRESLEAAISAWSTSL